MESVFIILVISMSALSIMCVFTGVFIYVNQIHMYANQTRSRYDIYIEANDIMSRPHSHNP